MQKFTAVLLFLLLMAGQVFSQRKPFPQHTAYYKHIKPSLYTQEELDYHVKQFYDKWKGLYLKNGCEEDHYYVYFDSDNTVTVSEAMGYGMMIMPLMAGYDPDAQKYFDGMFRYYRAHPSSLTPYLMAWKQITGCGNVDGDDSASDGDIDIAFGLLLAHEQWGSTGSINYLYFAKQIIADILGATATKGDVNQDLHTIKLGDWVTSGEYMTGTRTSDFITDHFKAFSVFSDDSLEWVNIANKCYNLVSVIQDDFSPSTGLLPDFIVDVDKDPKPAPSGYLEGDMDGNYSYNACRDPWRLAIDYLIFGDERAESAVKKINDWLFEKTGGIPAKIYAGYKLDGTSAANWTDVSFNAPFAVGAMLDPAKQQWLNELYLKVLYSKITKGGYYGNTLKLLALITLSGNYWVPGEKLSDGIRNVRKQQNEYFKVYRSNAPREVTVRIMKRFSDQVLDIKVYDAAGNLVVQKPVEDRDPARIDLSYLPAGLFVVSLISRNGRNFGAQKIIIE